MIKRIAQTINEANLVLEQEEPDIFHGEEPHVFSSPKWLQPNVNSWQMKAIFALIPKPLIRALELKRHDDTGGIENVRSLIRLVLRDHASSSKAGVVSDDVTSPADLNWLKEISNDGWDNVIYQIVHPFLEGTPFDVTAEKEHELVNDDDIIDKIPPPTTVAKWAVGAAARSQLPWWFPW